ncbi:MAG: hypothetical protein JRH20_28370, partial [Deltaproteobacteria bacterium]|nr:hypothetical protein [Deltaproteobacteria bacterium]
KTYLAAGTGQLFARTGWDANARAVRFFCGWLTVDHQHGEGNHFGFWRKGEWLTRDRTGYAEENPLSEYHNTLAIENGKVKTTEGWVVRYAKAGSQWPMIPAGDGKIETHSRGQGYLYVRGNATALYNSKQAGLKGVQRAVRELLWLEPDHVVVLDHAKTRKAGFKRFWMQLPGQASIRGSRAVAHTKGGQQLAITTLLPRSARLMVSRSGGHPAENVTMTHRLRVEGGKARAEQLFLHVVQGADGGRTLSKTGAIHCEQARCVGALINTTVVLFVRKGGEPLAFAAPLVKRVIAVGLRSGGKYQLKRHGERVRISSGGTLTADAAGVLSLLSP